MVPSFSVLIFLFIENLNYKNTKVIKNLFLICFFYFLFLYIHWPFLWEAPLKNFVNFIINSKDWIFSYYILFNGKYLLTTSLPDSYIFTWIGITTPILNLVLFISDLNQISRYSAQNVKDLYLSR